MTGLLAAATWLALAAGAALFLSVQGLLLWYAIPSETIEHAGWFLNSGRGVGAVGLACGIAGVLIGFGRRNGLVEATMLAAGATAAMCVTLVSIGPGTIFPIVIVFGTAIIAGATVVGAGVGCGVRRALGLDKG